MKIESSSRKKRLTANKGSLSKGEKVNTGVTARGEKRAKEPLGDFRTRIAPRKKLYQLDAPKQKTLTKRKKVNTSSPVGRR